MKKQLLTLLVVFISLASFAQGKIGFFTDSLHLVAWGNGQAVNSDTMPLGLPPLQVDLYMGTSSSQLYLYSSTTFGTLASGPGKWAPTLVIANANAATGAPGIPGASFAFIEVAVHSTERAAPNIYDPAILSTFQVFGSSVEFTFTLGLGITYPPMWSPTVGTWRTGTFDMDQYGVGSRAAIILVPEPSSVGLLILGGATVLVIGRRRKFGLAASK